MAQRKKNGDEPGPRDAEAAFAPDEGLGDGQSGGSGEISPLDDVPTRAVEGDSQADSQADSSEETEPGASIPEIAERAERAAREAGLGDADRKDTDPGLSPVSDQDTEELTAGEGVPPLADEPTPPEGARVLEFARGQAQNAEELPAGEGDEAADEDEPGRVPFEQLEPLIEALLFASDRPLNLGDLKRLSGEKDTRLVTQALEALIERRRGAGVLVVNLAGAYGLRTNPLFADWVSKLVAGKPVRLSRAMLETLSIVAYRQPITRPEIDDIRGVDCGPVLKTLLDRNLVRIIGKKEEVGRPMLYGTTPEFLRIFSLKDLTQLPTLRQFHELSAEHQAKVDEAHPAPEAAVGVLGAPPLEALSPPALAPEPGEDDRLIAELEEASLAATRAAGPLSPETPPGEPGSEGEPPRR